MTVSIFLWDDILSDLNLKDRSKMTIPMGGPVWIFLLEDILFDLYLKDSGKMTVTMGGH